MVFDISILEKFIWSGIASVGFGILFNIPRRIIFAVFLIGGLAGFIKFFSLANGAGIIISSLFAASFVGFSSIPVSRYKITSPFVVSIPTIIPMIPGYFGYKTLLGIMKLALEKNTGQDLSVFISVTDNALKMTFILFSLTIGVSLPWLIFREKGLQKIKLTKENNLV